MEGYWTRKKHKIKCPVCDKVVKITAALYGEYRKHYWRYDVQNGGLVDGQVVYPLEIRCAAIKEKSWKGRV